ncbi:7688_t:CDS:2, partial [Funneliformis caledonium]
TFKLQKFSLFQNLNIEQVKFKFSKNLIIIKVADAHYIYSNNRDHINFPIGRIVDTDCQEFEFVGNNDEFMITLSNNKIINIYFWKSNLKGSISFNKLVEFEDLDKSVHIEFKDQRVFVVSPEKLHIFNLTKHDWRNSIFKDHMINSNDNNDENILTDINEKYSSIKDKMEVVDEYVKDKIPENIKKTLSDVILKLYNDNRELNSLDIKFLADPSENKSKKQLINYILNTKYYF